MIAQGMSKTNGIPPFSRRTPIHAARAASDKSDFRKIATTIFSVHSQWLSSFAFSVMR